MTRARGGVRFRRAWGASVGLLLVLGAAAWLLGVAPWPLLAAALVIVALVIGQWTSWPFAIAGSLVVMLAGFGVVLRAAPHLGLGFVDAVGLAVLLVAATGLVVLLRKPELRLPTRRSVLVLAPAVLVPMLAVLVGGATAAARGAGPTWAMRNDAVWNMVTARLMIDDGGLRADEHPNSSPLTGGLIAAVASVGRSGVRAGDLLEHDVTRAAQLWLLLMLAGVLIAGLIGLRTAHAASVPMRIAASAASALVAASWYVTGFAVEFGFMNASVATLLLAASWLGWLETRVAPILGSALLSLAAVAMLATWAPLAAVPGGLAFAALVSRIASPPGRSSAALVWWALAALPIPLYGILVTLPDLRREGAALAVDGGIQALSPTTAAVTLAAALAAVALHAVRTRARHLLVGFLVFGASAAAGIAYLVAQRVAAGAGAWGYYPVKMTWMVCGLALVIVAAVLVAEAASIRRRRALTSVALVAGGALVGALMILVPPATVPRYHVLPFASIVTGTGVADSPAHARALFDVAYDGERRMAVRYIDDATDRFINAWLLQLESTTAQDPIRLYSYLLDPSSDQQVCEALRVWGGGVRVITSDPGLEARLATECPDAGAEVMSP